MNGSYKEEYSYIEAYVAKIERFNLESICNDELNKDGLLQGKSIFERMFIYFNTCK